jgi:Carbohydrate-binding family 9
MKRSYYLIKTTRTVEDILDWDSDFWHEVDIANICHFHPKSCSHHPITEVKLQYNSSGIIVLFRVKDKYVRSIHTQYNSKVNEDSCVEWFIKPPCAEGYYNFEINAGGTLHVNYIVDPERNENGIRKDMRKIPQEHAKQVKIFSSLPRVIDPEISEEIIWYLALNIPFVFFEFHTPLKKINGSIWQGNLYKCGDKISHPHWAAWNAIDELNFHQPKHFGEFMFVDKK